MATRFGFLMIASPQKLRGAFYTPPALCHYLAEWAIRESEDAILEPSCGDAEFLIAAAKQLSWLGNNNPALAGVEIDAASATVAANRLRALGVPSSIHQSDFFDFRPDRSYDVVLGNPPFIRYQNFSGEARTKALEASLRAGVRLSKLTNSWAPFLVHASTMLSDKGRLGMVVPAEMMSVNYAAPVRRFVLSRFRSVEIILFGESVFPGVSEEVVLLLAEGSGGTDCFKVFQAETMADLPARPSEGWSVFTPRAETKWSGALLSGSKFSVYEDAKAASGFCQLGDWGDVYLGAVSGNNRYFTLTEMDRLKRGIHLNDCVPISPPGSRHLRGLRFSKEAWKTLLRDGKSVHLFAPASDRLRIGAAKYIESGLRSGVDEAYKCKMRSPWWQVPLVRCPHLFLTYMNHEIPRLVGNEARANILNSLHGVALKSGCVELGRKLLPISALNSLTLLGAEMVGRSYGGGILKLEPREASQLPLPPPAVVEEAKGQLKALVPQVSAMLRAGKLEKAIKSVDRLLLKKHLGMRSSVVEAIGDARNELMARRMARGRRGDA